MKPGATFTAFNHGAFTATSGTQDCSSCHSWPGTGTSASPNWFGAGASPQSVSVGGFTIPQPPATTVTAQLGINNLPHPNVATGVACTACHTTPTGGRSAIGYDHLSTLIKTNCGSCHEAGTNLVGTLWNGATVETSGAGDSRPFTLTAVVWKSRSIPYPKHFYPVDCNQCHVVPAGNGNVTTETVEAHPDHIGRERAPTGVRHAVTAVRQAVIRSWTRTRLGARRPNCRSTCQSVLR